MIIACLALTVQAQDSIPSLKIGFFSYDSALKTMPDYTLQQQKLAELRAQYDAELKRVEEEFNRKYEEFLDGQKEFPKTILYKRQTELKELMERNVNFKANSRRELAEAEQAAMLPLRQNSMRCWQRLLCSMAMSSSSTPMAILVPTSLHPWARILTS